VLIEKKPEHFSLLALYREQIPRSEALLGTSSIDVLVAANNERFNWGGHHFRK